jgi:hypothetical protein
MKTTILVLLLAGSTPLWAQYPVNDAVGNSLAAKQNADFLEQMATSFQKLDAQIQRLEGTLQNTTRLVQMAGDPQAALGLIGGLGDLGSLVGTIQASSVFRLGSEIAQTVDSAESLLHTGQGLYRSIPTSLPDGTSIMRDLGAFKPFAAHESEQRNFADVLVEAQNERKRLLAELNRTLARVAGTQAEEHAKQTKVMGIVAALEANDSKVRDANQQEKERQAMKEQARTMEGKFKEVPSPGHRR